MRKLSLFMLLLALPLVTACDSSDPEPPPPPGPPALSGQWNGSTNVGGLQYSLSLQLVENSGVVNGNGSFIAPGQGTIAVTANGTYNFPSVALTIRSTGFSDMNYTGTLSADGRTLNGTLSGSGAENFGLTLTRQ